MAKLMLELRYKTGTQTAGLFMPFTCAFLLFCQAKTSDFITQKVMASR